jgi:hypothetical protein
MPDITPKQVQATIDYVKSLARGRTRFEGSELYRDEILVGEIERLREVIRDVNTVAGTAEEPRADALSEICKTTYAALNQPDVPEEKVIEAIKRATR